MAATSRMLTLLSLMQSQRDWPGRVLADRLGVTTRTVRRDVDRLRELGYRIESAPGPDGGYRMDAGAHLPPLLFDDDQAVALAIALRLVGDSGVDLAEAADRALVTVRQVMPARLRHRIDGVEFSATPATVVVDPEVLRVLSEAVRTRYEVRFDYAGRSGPARRVQPHALVARRGRWYVLAWDLERDDWRSFRADRLVPRIPGGPRFVPRPIPGGDPAAFLDTRLAGADDDGRWPCVGRFEIRLSLHEVIAWVQDGQVEPLGEDWSRVTLGAWSWAGLIARIVGFDAQFRLIAPQELLDAADTLQGRLGSAVLPLP